MAFLSLGPKLPSVEISIDFTNDPTSSTRTWTDVTAYVRRFSVRRGRENELSRSNPGELTATLSNSDRRFDPTYTSSPYSPGVVPMRRVRVRAQWDSVTYNLFSGYVEAWNPSWPATGKDATVELIARDAFVVLNLYDLVGKSYGTAYTGDRAATVLYDAGFMTSDYSLNTGQSSLPASGTLTTTTALAHIQDVVESENGVFFVNGGGTLVFQDRHYRIKNESAASGTVGDSAGEIRYDEIAAVDQASDIWNQVRVTPAGGTAEVVVDASSTASYYTRTLDKSLLITSQTEANDAARWLLARYSTPAVRVNQVRVVGARGTALWAQILGAEISKRYIVNRRPPGGGTISEGQYVEAIGHDVVVNRNWRTSWQMSPNSSQAFWILGDAVYSLLGDTTVLGY